MTELASVFDLKELRVDRGGVQILDIPSFSLHENEFVSLIGPNGAGKSTLFLPVMGLIKRKKRFPFIPGRRDPHRSLLA